MREGAKVQAVVDATRRAGIRRAHSATHILHYALQKNLGSHAQQQGSKVDDDWLRFDFTNLSPVSGEQLAAIQRRRGRAGRGGRAGEVGDAAAGRGPQAGRDDAVRREVSRPGADGVDGHVQQRAVRRHASDNTGEVEQFEILSEEGVSAGTRRITALTGAKAAEHVEADRSGARARRRSCSACRRWTLPEAATALAAQARELRKQLTRRRCGGAKPQAAVRKAAGDRRSRRMKQMKHDAGGSGAAAVGRAARGAAADRGASRRTSRRWKSSSPSGRRPGRCRATAARIGRASRRRDGGGHGSARRRSQPDAAADRPGARQGVVRRPCCWPAGRATTK